MTEEFAAVLRDLVADCAPIAQERAQLRGLPRACYWSEGSHMVPFWRDYWRRVENRGSHLDLPIFKVLDEEFDFTPVEESSIPSFLLEGLD